LASGPFAGFNALVVLGTLGIVAELYSGSFPSWLKLVFVVATVGLSALVLQVQFYRPAVDAAEDYQAQLMAILFSTILTRYRHENPGTYNLRINVMKIRRSKIGYPLFLKMDFWTTDYSPVEIAQVYHLRQGCCGWAFDRNEQVFFDRIERQEAQMGMTPAQLDATAHVHSILSTPIYRNGRLDDPIAILNLDSYDPIGRTGFDQATMRQLVAAYATVIGAFLK
jgi:hypothetical protein